MAFSYVLKVSARDVSGPVFETLYFIINNHRFKIIKSSFQETQEGTLDGLYMRVKNQVMFTDLDKFLGREEMKASSTISKIFSIHSLEINGVLPLKLFSTKMIVNY